MSEIPESVLDSVRQLLIYMQDSGAPKLGTLRFYAKYDRGIVIPEWAKDLPDETKLTKESLAEVFYRTFKKAEEGLI